MNAFKLIFISALSSLTLANGATAAPGAQASPCFLNRNINGFSAPNDRTVYVRVGVKDVWRLDLMNDCTGLSFRNSFGLQGSPTGPWICRPLDATVIVSQTGIRQRCPVSALRRLTPEEVAALPKRDRP
ncbi:MAG TPA: DUF6491 family protein [Caulobacteraceae bacterium]